MYSNDKRQMFIVQGLKYLSITYSFRSYCSFHWNGRRLKTKYLTPNVSRNYLLSFDFEKRIGCPLLFSNCDNIKKLHIKFGHQSIQWKEHIIASWWAIHNKKVLQYNLFPVLLFSINFILMVDCAWLSWHVYCLLIFCFIRYLCKIHLV